MKSLTLILLLCASPVAWANGSQHQQPAQSLNDLIAYFSTSPLSGLSRSPTSSPSGRPAMKGGRRVDRRDVGRAFLFARESGRGISVQPFGQQMNTGPVRGPAR